MCKDWSIRKRSGRFFYTLGWILLLVGGVQLVACKRVRLKTRPYTWRAKMYKEKPQQDWYIPPKGKKELKAFKKKFGWCSDTKLRAYHDDLKKFTHTCAMTMRWWGATGLQSRAWYNTLLTFSLLGGTAVIAAQIFTVVEDKENPTNPDPALTMTIVGASVTAIASLWLQVGNYGDKSNKAFNKYTGFSRLIQNSEVEWQTSVCNASSRKIALINAAKILGQMSKQCIYEAPKVEVNPNVAKAVQNQQKNVSETLTRYQNVRNIVEAEQDVQRSRENLERLEKEVARLHKEASSASSIDPQKYGQLRSLCAQADSEYKRYHSLSKSSNKDSSGDAKPKGAWAGICNTLPSPEQAQRKASLRKSNQQSRAILNKLVSQILAAQAKMNSEDKDDDDDADKQKKLLRSYCVQAAQEYTRYSAIQDRLLGSKKHSGSLPPGAWYGVCKLHAPESLSGMKATSNTKSSSSKKEKKDKKKEDDDE